MGTCAISLFCFVIFNSIFGGFAEPRTLLQINCNTIRERHAIRNTFIVSEELLRQVDGNLQTIVNCVRPKRESIIAFNTTDTIQLSSSIMIDNTRKITFTSLRALQAEEEDLDHQDLMVELTVSPGQSFLDIRSSNVILDHFHIANVTLMDNPLIIVNGRLKLQHSLIENVYTRVGSIIEGKRKSTVKSMDTVFENTESETGIRMKKRSLLTIVRNQMTNNRNGGFVRSTGEVYVRNTDFIRNTGGCIFSNNSDLTVLNSNFTQNTGTNGAALRMEGGQTESQVIIRKCDFHGNTAENGGALYLNRTGNLTLLDSDFQMNRAQSNGGAVLLNGFYVNITNCTFLQNQAGVHQSLTNQSCPSSFTGRLDGISSRGGAIYVDNIEDSPNSSFICLQSKFQNNSASIGGALRLPLSSRLSKIENSRFLTNEALFGGAVFLNASFEAPVRSNSSITGTAFDNNRACFGGAMYGTRTENDIITLEQLSFQSNSAIRSGSVISSTHPAPFSFLCNTTSATEKIPFDSALLTAMEGDCGSTLFGNQVDLTRMRSFSTNGVRLTVEPEQITGHKSGDFLPPVRVRYLDAFDQTVPGDQLWITILNPEQDNISLQGQRTIPLNQGDAEFNEILLSALPGEYGLTVVLSSTFQESFTIQVEDCSSTERREGLICEPCPSGICRTCPEHAICEGTVIIPDSGYWSPGPRSDQLRKCVRFQSCERDPHTLLPSALQGTNDQSLVIYDWCQEDYEGVLCGSCADNQGHVAGYECIQCNDGLSEFFACFLALYTLLIILLLIKTSWISDLNPLPQQGPSRQPQEVEMEAVVCEIEADDSPVRQHVEPRASFGIKEINGDINELRKKVLEATGSTTVLHGTVPASSTVQQSNEERNQILNQLAGIPLATIESSEDSTVLAKPFVSECIKIIITFLQTCSLALYIQIQWSSASTGLLKTFGLLSGAGSPFVSLECLFDQNDEFPASLKAQIFLLGIPVALALILVWVWILLSIFVDRSLSVFWQRVQNTFVAVFYFAFLPITHTCFRTLQCESVDVGSGKEDAFWIEDTQVECWKGSHMNIVYFVIIPMLVVVSLGLPLCFSVFLMSHRTLGKTERLRTWGLLYEAYKYKRRYWELMVFLRKALLALIFGFGYHYSVRVQSLVAMGVCICFLVIHAIASPYEKSEKRLDRMEVVSLFGSISVFFSASLINALQDRYQTLFILFVVFSALIVLQLLLGLWIHVVRSVDWALADFGREEDYSKLFIKKLAIVVSLRASCICSRIQGIYKNCVGCLKGKCSFNR